MTVTGPLETGGVVYRMGHMGRNWAGQETEGWRERAREKARASAGVFVGRGG